MKKVQMIFYAIQHRLDCRSMQAECGCTEKIWQSKEIMGWSAWEWQKEARYGFCWPSESFWVERTPSRKTCQKAQPSVEENGALKWIWWWFKSFQPYVRHILSCRLGHENISAAFSLFRWFKKSCCQLLVKECALSTGELPRRLAQEQCG